MRNAIALITAISLSSPAVAQNVQFADLSTAELIQEVEFITELAKPVNMDRVEFGNIMFYFAQYGFCNGLSKEEADNLAKPFAILASAISGKSLDGEIPIAHWNRAGGGTCPDGKDRLLEIRQIISAIELQIRARASISIRQKEIMARVLPPTELSQFAADQIVTLEALRVTSE